MAHLITKQFTKVTLTGMGQTHYYAVSDNEELAKLLAKKLRCPVKDVAVITPKNELVFLEDAMYNSTLQEVLAFQCVRGKSIGNINAASSTRVLINEELLEVRFDTAEELYSMLAKELKCPINKMLLMNCNMHIYDLRTGKERSPKKFTEFPYYIAFCPTKQ